MCDIASDPRFRPILLVLIRQGNIPISLSEISERSNFSTATVKRHLQKLKLFQVVEVHRGGRGQGQRSYYRVNGTIERLVIAN